MTALERALSPLQRFVASEVAGGVVLIAAAVLALALANSPLAPAYQRVLQVHIAVAVGRGQDEVRAVQPLFHDIRADVGAMVQREAQDAV